MYATSFWRLIERQLAFTFYAFMHTHICFYLLKYFGYSCLNKNSLNELNIFYDAFALMAFRWARNFALRFVFRVNI